MCEPHRTLFLLLLPYPTPPTSASASSLSSGLTTSNFCTYKLQTKCQYSDSHYIYMNHCVLLSNR